MAATTTPTKANKKPTAAKATKPPADPPPADRNLDPADHPLVAKLLALVADIRAAEARAAVQRRAGREPDLTAAVGVVFADRESRDGRYVTGKAEVVSRDGVVLVREFLPSVDPQTGLEDLTPGPAYWYPRNSLEVLTPADALMNLAMQVSNGPEE